MTTQRIHALTLRANPGGRLRALQCECEVCPAFDPALLRTGWPHPPLKKFLAIWDTGASGSAISPNVVKECGLQPSGMKRVQTANGYHDAETVLINMRLPNGVGFAQIEVTIGDMGPLPGAQILIGMDIITRGDFAVTNVGGNTVCSFRVPSLREIDYVKELNAAPKPGLPPSGGTSPKSYGMRAKKHK